MTQFINISRVVRLVGVSRSTIYYWMDRGLIHWRVLPSGRRVVCYASLSSPARKSSAERRAMAVGSGARI